MKLLVLAALLGFAGQAFAQIKSLDAASMLKIKLDETFEEVKMLPVASWLGDIGIKGSEVKTSLSDFMPLRTLPFHAVLTPPTGFTYLGANLKNLSIYFTPKDGNFVVYGVTLNLELTDRGMGDLGTLLARQFGPTKTGHWAENGKVLLCFPPELGLFDLKLQAQAEAMLPSAR